MSIGGPSFVISGSRGATFGAMGFFSAGVLSLGAAATVGTLGTAAAAGFAGGLTLHAPAIALRLCLHKYGVFDQAHRGLVAAVDLSLLALTMPVGAWMLGLAVQPFVIAAAVAVLLHVLYNCLQAVFGLRQAQREQQSWRTPEPMTSILSDSLTSSRHQNIDESEVTLAIGSFC
ncbi:MAG: hypothetical protein NXI01_04985 [Gammaproteobacteria bacterium]|nr:hypothetical protein [Gammaproteobacteria bacterium]